MQSLESHLPDRCGNISAQSLRPNIGRSAGGIVGSHAGHLICASWLPLATADDDHVVHANCATREIPPLEQIMRRARAVKPGEVIGRPSAHGRYVYEVDADPAGQV
jgi:hypothetical protein